MNVALCRCVKQVAGWGDDRAPGECDKDSIDHDPHV